MKNLILINKNTYQIYYRSDIKGWVCVGDYYTLEGANQELARRLQPKDNSVKSRYKLFKRIETYEPII